MKVVAQRIGHGPECFVNICVIGFSADDEKDVGPFEPVFVDDSGYIVHLFIGWVATEIGGDSGRITQLLGDQCIGSPPKVIAVMVPVGL